MKGTRVRAFMPKNFRRPEKLTAFIKMEQFYGQPVREPLRNGKRSGQKTVVLHLAETPQITGGNSAVRMGERHRMISAYDNAVRTGEQPLMTKSVIFAR